MVQPRGLPKSSVVSKPSGTIFRWAGSKARVRDALLDIMAPEGALTYKRWVSPFLGAGSLELTAMDRGVAQSYLLADINPAICDVFHLLRSPDLSWLIDELQRFAALPVEFQKAQFQAERSRVVGTGFAGQPFRVLRFLILQACSFNGLWRVNRSGQYNVPWGRPASFDFDAMHRASALLRDCHPLIVESDFAALLSDEHHWIGKGDIIYADPPYLGEHSAYSSGGFDTIHHQCLAHWLSVAARAGATCWASGSDCDLTRQIYGMSGVRFHSIPVSRSISCKGSTRGTKTELLIQFPVGAKIK